MATLPFQANKRRSRERFADLEKVLTGIEKTESLRDYTGCSSIVELCIVTCSDAVKKYFNDWPKRDGQNIRVEEKLPLMTVPGSVLLVDMDCYVVLDVGVRQLLNFRLAHPSQPLIVFSSDFSRNDFGIERLPLADLSLKWPFYSNTLDTVIGDALVNNQIWQQRLDKIKQTS